jgi:hypothetical protein
MPSVFDRPIQASYLLIEGTDGTRTPTAAKALLEPGAVQLDAYVNTPRSRASPETAG